MMVRFGGITGRAEIMIRMETVLLPLVLRRILPGGGGLGEVDLVVQAVEEVSIEVVEEVSIEVEEEISTEVEEE